MSHLITYTKIMLPIILLASIIMICTCSHADVEINKIIQIESSGNPKAYNADSKARGLMQVTPICLKEYNNFHKLKYSTNQLFDAEINVKIGTWYINKRIPQMLKYYKLQDTIRNRLICYNWGVGNLLSGEDLPTETKNYINKYGEN